ncbi:MAG: hypothetical protein WCN85_12065 [Burkholderiales bacterium]
MRLPASITAWSAGSIATTARAGLSIMLRDLDFGGWVGLALIALAGALTIDAHSLDRQTVSARQSAEEARSQALRYSQSKARNRQVSSAAPPAESIELPVLSGDAGSAVLPSSFFEQAARRGIKLGAVEYRWNAQSQSVQRVDVLISASGRYLPARQWLTDALAQLPHAQLSELSMQRTDPADPELEIRLVMAVHFGRRT